MANCNRNKTNNEGVVNYKRHQYKAGICRFCGTSQVEQHKALVTRRERRRAARKVQSEYIANPVIYA